MMEYRTCIQRDGFSVTLVYVQVYVCSQDVFGLRAAPIAYLLDSFTLASFG
jgi:hypothetical protein